MSSPITLRAKFLNSSSVKTSLIFSVSGGHIIKSSSLNSTSTSMMIVANILETNPCSAKLMTFSFCFPFNSSACSIKPSTEPYFSINILEVFSPIPGIPGILSAASPHKPRISITFKGSSTPNFAHISGIPQISGGFPPRPGLYMNIFSETSCPKSLSGVIM